MNSNLKDTLSTICAAVTAFCGGLGIVLAGAGVTMPVWLLITLGVIVLAANVISQVVIGKNPNLTTKTEAQVENLNAQSKM